MLLSYSAPVVLKSSMLSHRNPSLLTQVMVEDSSNPDIITIPHSFIIYIYPLSGTLNKVLEMVIM